MALGPTKRIIESDQNCQSETTEHGEVLPYRPPPGIHDPTISLEEYMYYASITRTLESQYELEPSVLRNVLGKLGKKKSRVVVDPVTMIAAENDKEVEESKVQVSDVPSTRPLAVSDEEWDQASRAVRTATWSAVFYLVTADIMGPYSAPWAMAQLGYGPGISIYVIFGLLAGWYVDNRA